VLAVVALAAALLATGAVAAPRRAAATSGFTDVRYGGQDRYDTAAQVGQAAFPNGAINAVIASGENFPDALAGAYLAGVKSAPMLLTPSARLSDFTAAALRQLKTKNVFLLGGPNAISPAVESQLSSQASTSQQGGNLVVTRIAGPGRYDTAALIATNGGPVGAIGNAPTAVVASGANFPDALSGGPASVAKNFPILLTDPSFEPQQTENALEQLGITNILLLGGTSAVSDGAKSQLSHNGSRTVTRIAGADRTDTAAQFYEFGITNLSFSVGKVALANGTVFPGPDALAGAPLAGHAPTGILLAATADTLGSFTTNEISKHASTLTLGLIFGGSASISPAAESQFRAAAGGSSPGPISLSSTTVQAGQAVHGTVANPSTISSITVSGCGLSSQSVPFDSNGNFSVTIPSTQAAGTCTLTFTTKDSSGGTTVQSFAITVTAATLHGLPVLKSASLTLGGPGSGGDSITYAFDPPPNPSSIPTANNFRVYRPSGAFAAGVGTPQPATNGWTVRFPAGATYNAALATVWQGAVPGPAGNFNIEGAVAVSAPAVQNVTTLAPDLTAVAVQTAGTGLTATFTFDQPLKSTSSPSGPPASFFAASCAAGGPCFELVDASGVTHKESSSTPPTLAAANQVNVTFDSVPLPTQQISRAVVQAGRIESTDPSPLGNPLESVSNPTPAPPATAKADLVGATEINCSVFPAPVPSPPPGSAKVFGGATTPQTPGMATTPGCTAAGNPTSNPIVVQFLFDRPLGGTGTACMTDGGTLPCSLFSLIDGGGVTAVASSLSDEQAIHALFPDPSDRSRLNLTFKPGRIASATGVSVATDASAPGCPTSPSSATNTCVVDESVLLAPGTAGPPPGVLNLPEVQKVTIGSNDTTVTFVFDQALEPCGNVSPPDCSTSDPNSTFGATFGDEECPSSTPGSACGLPLSFFRIYDANGIAAKPGAPSGSEQTACVQSGGGASNSISNDAKSYTFSICNGSFGTSAGPGFHVADAQKAVAAGLGVQDATVTNVPFPEGSVLTAAG